MSPTIGFDAVLTRQDGLSKLVATLKALMPEPPRVTAGRVYRLNYAFEERIKDKSVFPRCTMLHSAQGIGPTTTSSFLTLLSNSDPASSVVFGPLAGSW